MPLTATRTLMDDAAVAHRGIGAFNVIHLETAEAIVAAAEAADRPVILQISQNCVSYHGGLLPIGTAALALAGAARIPVAVHLDHAEDESLARQAIDLGFGSVMFDGATLPYAENVAATARVVSYAHANGAFVEAELGEIGGKDGAHAPGVRTDPDEAVRFVHDTGVDALAVAVGSSHAMLTRDAVLDVGLIAAIARAVSVPLVLHGSSGVPDADLAAAVAAGMTKVNVATQLNKVFTDAVRRRLAGDVELVDPRKYGSAGREAIAAEVTRLLGVLGAGERR
jgi:fructose-bisphosphate aldolase class II